MLNLSNEFLKDYYSYKWLIDAITYMFSIIQKYVNFKQNEYQHNFFRFGVEIWKICMFRNRNTTSHKLKIREYSSIQGWVCKLCILNKSLSKPITHCVCFFFLCPTTMVFQIIYQKLSQSNSIVSLDWSIRTHNHT